MWDFYDLFSRIAPLARLIALVDQGLAAAGIVFPVLGLNGSNAGTGRQVELPCIRIHHVGACHVLRDCRARCHILHGCRGRCRGLRRCCIYRRRGACGIVLPVSHFCQGGIPGCVVNPDAGLDIVGVDTEGEIIILNGLRLHQDPGGDEVVPIKDRRHAVEDMVAGPLHIGGRVVLIRPHALHIHVPGTCDEVFCVGILSGKFISDQVAAVVEIVAVHDAAIFHGMPARRLHGTDGSARFRRHDFPADIGIGCAAPAQLVEGAVGLKGRGCEVAVCEVGRIIIDYKNRVAGIGGNGSGIEADC